MFQEDKFKKKYLKYKKKYLSMNGGGFYSAKKYEISPSGDKISLVHDEDYNYMEKRNIRHVFNHVKISTFITQTLYDYIIEKINLDKCNIINLIYKIDGLDNKYLFFCDIDSKNIFLELFNGQDENSKLIFPVDLKVILLPMWGASYPLSIKYERTLLFIIFSGLLFSYDIKDIYGFFIDFCSEEKFIIQNPNFCLSMDIFFDKLKIVIDIILETFEKIKHYSKSPTFIPLTGDAMVKKNNDDMKTREKIFNNECLFNTYVNDILKTNFYPNNNFQTSDYMLGLQQSTDRYIRYHLCLKPSSEPIPKSKKNDKFIFF
jgi:hypothetical protein